MVAVVFILRRELTLPLAPLSIQDKPVFQVKMFDGKPAPYVYTGVASNPDEDDINV
jgi:hypothetical protein